METVTFENFDEIEKKEYSKRIRLVRRESKLSSEEFAKRIGITRSGLANAENAGSKLRNKYSYRIAKEFGVNYEWLVVGIGSMNGELIERRDGEMAKVHLVEGAALAGLGNQAPTQDTDIQETFYLPLKTKGTKYAIRVSGNSMYPVIQNESLLLLEPMTQQSDFKDGRDYVIVSNSMTFVKKVNYLFTDEQGGKFRLSSHNESTTLEIYADEIQKWYKITHVINEL